MAVGVAVCGSIADIAVGIGMAFFFVSVLRPLFIFPPPFEIPAGSIGQLTAFVVGATVVTAAAATSLVNRLRPTELLRDE